jgi:hypothetical protein
MSALLAAALACAACASSIPLRAERLPSDATERTRSVDQLGETLFMALRSGRPRTALAPVVVLDDLLVPSARLRGERARAETERLGETSGWPIAWASARYAGFCAQGGRDEPALNGLGLREEAWVVSRVLLVGEAGSTRTAAWVEGAFVFTERGFQVLWFSRLEGPRAGHADLDLAPCDVERGIR